MARMPDWNSPKRDFSGLNVAEMIMLRLDHEIHKAKLTLPRIKGNSFLLNLSFVFHVEITHLQTLKVRLQMVPIWLSVAEKTYTYGNGFADV